MEQIRDMVFVKWVQRKLGRALTENELNGEQIRVKHEDGRIEYLAIPLLSFPYDLLTRPSDFYQPEVIYLENAS